MTLTEQDKDDLRLLVWEARRFLLGGDRYDPVEYERRCAITRACAKLDEIFQLAEGPRFEIVPNTYRCTTPMCGESGVCDECKRQAAKFFVTRDGLILCASHFREAFLEMDPPYRQRPRDANGDGRELTKQERETLERIGTARCMMCHQSPASGRTCQHCGTPLHPLWPAVYCSNECAYEDA